MHQIIKRPKEDAQKLFFKKKKHFKIPQNSSQPDANRIM